MENKDEETLDKMIHDIEGTYDIEALERIKKENMMKIGDDMSAEKLVKLFAPIFQQISKIPIDNFEFNILKAKILYATAIEIETVWPRISVRLAQYEREKSKTEKKETLLLFIEALVKFFGNGAASYFVYTEYALVTAISALEIYFRDRFIYEIKNNKKSLDRLSDIEIRIKVKRLLEISHDMSDNIDKLVLDSKNFQSLQDIKEIYKKLFDKPFIGRDEELKEIEKIFVIRHLIIHRGGIVDEKFLQKFRDDKKLLYRKLLDFELNNLNIGEKLILDRDQIIKIINFIENVIIDLDSSLRPFIITENSEIDN